MILDRIFGLETRAAVKWTGAALSQDATAKRIWGTSGETTAGVEITEANATAISAVYRAVALYAGTIGHLPLFVYRRTSDQGDKEPARSHPMFRLLSRKPNADQTAIEMRQLWMAYTLLWGRSYSYIEHDGAGRTVGLWPMPTDSVKRYRTAQGRIAYDVSKVQDSDLLARPPVRSNTLLATDVLELSTYDGESIVSHARDQLGEARAANNFAAGFFAGGAQPYLVLKHPGVLKDPDKFRANWQAVHGGSKRRVGVLEEGMDVSTVGMPLDDAQFLESRQFHVAEIARWFGVPPHKLMDLTRATFSNIEEQNLEWRESLLPWLEMIEQRLDTSVLTEPEQEAYYCEHVLDELLRANTLNRYQAYEIGERTGVHSINDLLRMEGKNGIGSDGDIRLVPANLIPLSLAKQFWESKKTPEPQPQPAPAGDAPDDEPEEPEGGDGDQMNQDPPAPDANRQAARAAVLAAVSRMVGKEIGEVRKAGGKPEKFLDWLDKFYTDWPAKLRAGLTPAAEACRSLGVPVDIEPVVTGHPTRSRAALLELSGSCPASKFGESLARELASWEASLAEALTKTLLKE